jgi:hypothetical protein
MPTSLRRRTIHLEHIGHQGIINTKRLLRSKVWFPDIDKMVEETIQNCLPYQAATSGNHPPPEPLKMTQLPTAPWKEVAMDFLGPFPTGEYLVVVIDALSRFPEVDVLTTVSANAVLPKLDAIFSRQGFPEVLKSDNGPPFNGAEFEFYSPQDHAILASSKWRGRAFYAHTTEVYSGCNHREEKLEASDEPVSPQLQGNPPFHN